MDKATRKLAITLLTAGLAGLAIGYVDSRPTWDDAGITAGALLITGAVLGALAPRWFWLTGLVLGAPVFIWNVWAHGNYGSALAVGIALVGAGLGAASGALFLGDRAAR